MQAFRGFTAIALGLATVQQEQGCIEEPQAQYGSLAHASPDAQREAEVFRQQRDNAQQRAEELQLQNDGLQRENARLQAELELQRQQSVSGARDLGRIEQELRERTERLERDLEEMRKKDASPGAREPQIVAPAPAIERKAPTVMPQSNPPRPPSAAGPHIERAPAKSPAATQPAFER